jgi:hypothetical protein
MNPDEVVAAQAAEAVAAVAATPEAPTTEAPAAAAPAAVIAEPMLYPVIQVDNGYLINGRVYTHQTIFVLAEAEDQLGQQILSVYHEAREARQRLMLAIHLTMTDFSEAWLPDVVLYLRKMRTYNSLCEDLIALRQSTLRALIPLTVEVVDNSVRLRIRQATTNDLLTPLASQIARLTGFSQVGIEARSVALVLNDAFARGTAAGVTFNEGDWARLDAVHFETTTSLTLLRQNTEMWLLTFLNQLMKHGGAAWIRRKDPQLIGILFQSRRADGTTPALVANLSTSAVPPISWLVNRAFDRGTITGVLTVHVEPAPRTEDLVGRATQPGLVVTCCTTSYTGAVTCLLPNNGEEARAYVSKDDAPLVRNIWRMIQQHGLIGDV